MLCHVRLDLSNGILLLQLGCSEVTAFYDTLGCSKLTAWFDIYDCSLVMAVFYDMLGYS